MRYQPGRRTRVAHALLLTVVAVSTLVFVRILFPQFSGVELAAGGAVMLAASAVVGIAPPVLAAPVVAAASTFLVVGPWAEATAAGATIWVAFAVSLISAAAAQVAADRRAVLIAFLPFALFASAVALSSHTLLGALGALAPVLGGTTAGLWIRLRAAQRERRALAERQARADERLALAAQLHDLASARLTRIVLAARELGSPGIEADAQEALFDVRRVVVELQTSEAPREDLSTSETAAAAEVNRAVGEVVLRARAVGQQVDLVCGVSATVPRATADCLTRVVEEGLTNARKHAAGARVAVEVTDHGVSVRNSPAAGDPRLAGTGSGTGLRGLAARTSLVGGTLRHGRSPDGAWTLAAVFE